MAQWAWIFDPHSDGEIISKELQEQTRRKILTHAVNVCPTKASSIHVRFQGAFCYINVQEPGNERTMPLCRLRYKGLRGWSVAFYTYSDEAYAPCLFPSGKMMGTPEEGLEVGVVSLG